MDFIITIAVMTIVGSLIGGITNHLAIKMLFHPLEPKFIGKWQLPFTPGLIPKRRGMLAEQLGKTVVNYLLTPETFRKRFFNDDMKEKTSQFLVTQLTTHVFTNDKTLQDWLHQAGIENAATKVEQKVDTIIQQQVDQFQNVLSTQAVEQLIPVAWQEKAEMKIPEIARYILTRGDDYFESEKGQETIRGLIGGFLNSKGSFGGMIQMFVGDGTSLVPLIHKEVKKFLNADGTFLMLNNVLTNEWDKLKVKTVPEMFGKLDFTSTTTALQNYAKREIKVQERLDLPLVHYWPNGLEWIEQNVLQKAIDVTFEKAEAQLPKALERMNLQEVVREQVNQFPIETIEDLVLGIIKSELKWITILGFILGGLIGIFQGFFSWYM